MSAYRAIMDMEGAEWQRALSLSDADLPDAVIVEGTWWREERTAWRLGYLDNVRELDFPDIFWGQWQGKNVIFCCAYGAARTAEVIHLCGSLGAKLSVQIGTCGGLQPQLKPGDVILPEVALCREGVAYLYDAVEASHGTDTQLDAAEAALEAREHRVHRGTHLTWTTLFAQSGRMIETWNRAGYLSVDMETATTYAVSEYFNVETVSLLVVWDDLTRGRSFLDPMTDDETAALDRANQSVYEVALKLVAGL